MKVIINKDVCIGCGACQGCCAKIEINDDGYAEVKGEITAEDKAAVMEAKDGCPVGAIEVEE